jgi:DNA polymerase III delta prime subunit
MRYADSDSTKRERRTTVRNIITVNQIRAVTDALNKSAGLGSSKICLIYPADALNLNAANALLKSLEEPTGGTYFLLVSSSPSNLPPTIRSRCSRLNLNNPTSDESIEWLTAKHKVDLKVAQQLITHGLGPYEVLQMNTRENLEAHQALIDGLTSLISGNISAGAFARQSGIYDIVLTLKVIQSEIHRGLRKSAQPHHDTDVPVLISPDLAVEFREALFSVYFAIGRFLSWPKKSVDEQLFLEDVALKLAFCAQTRG